MPAKELYVSNWFVKSKRFVEMQPCNWYILSAKYGLTAPDSPIENYNMTLKLLKKDERHKWSHDVATKLKEKEHIIDEVVILAGKYYREFLVTELLTFCKKVIIPLEGLRLGEQISWLNSRIKNG
nr:DUF6884 domain-containing protein [Solidesulfovibrio alcoholivorans]